LNAITDAIRRSSLPNLHLSYSSYYHFGLRPLSLTLLFSSAPLAQLPYCHPAYRPGMAPKQRDKQKNKRAAGALVFFIYMSYLLKICAGGFRNNNMTGSMPVMMLIAKIKARLIGGMYHGKYTSSNEVRLLSSFTK
jgi:hypothetical protein